jgi:RNA polymerase sigma-70 factor (ECF subfamily)
MAEASGVTTDDSSLVSAARAGDRSAFGELYARYRGMVHALLMAHVPAPAADDLVQEVFVRALQKIASLRDSEAFGGWLAAIARNRGRDFFRRTRPEEELVEVGRRPLQSEESEAAAALEAIRTLPEAYREPLLMRLVEGMTGPEIASRTGLSPGSVRVNLHRGMKMLHQRLGIADAADEPSPDAEEKGTRNG